MKFKNIYHETEENMRLALLSIWAPGSHPMRPAIEGLFKKEPLLAEPVFQSTFGWEPVEANDESWRHSINQEVWELLEQNRNRQFVPFKHQAESWKALADGNSIVVTSGTGSGKTECFMYPVMSDLYEQNQQNAIEAIFLYPLNALMEDQKRRLSEYCVATGRHFAVYNGDTPENHDRYDGNDPLPNEIRTREEIRNTPPEILLTNPSMLEYILVRRKDQQMIQSSAGQLRWIVIDEAHTYSGAAAIELAYQIKRILDAFGESASDVRFACTSATIGDEEGTQSLVKFISSIIGQPEDKIKVIGGRRLVKPLDKERLQTELEGANLPSAEKVISFRTEINESAGMTLKQIWESLGLEEPYSIASALELIDKLCDMSQDGIPVLSLRGHFFMRAISGIYACANQDCPEANNAMPLYGHLTTYKSTTCPECGAPLLEIVQCKHCGEFILMGNSDSQTHRISPCDDSINTYDYDYFAIDSSDDDDNDTDTYANGQPDTFFLAPFDREHFFNPIKDDTNISLEICHENNAHTLNVNRDNAGQWVEVRNDHNASYCPSCGNLAQDNSHLRFKHFRIPINFINQTISPALLHECAPAGQSWGKYIAFTDSRQGTAISAKTFNITEERLQCGKKIICRLAKLEANNDPLTKLDPTIRAILTPEQIKSIRATAPSPSTSLQDCANRIFDERMFAHIDPEHRDNDDYKSAYTAALLRGIIGRRPAYETNLETMGLISLEYPGLQDIRMPEALSHYAEAHHIKIDDNAWRDYLKLALDYEIRLNNHIQPISDRRERDYMRDSNRSTPIAAPDDNRPNIKKWPTIKVNNRGQVSDKQNRIIVLLCAGLGIHTREQLQTNLNIVENILSSAWTDLRDHVLTEVATNGDGYNSHIYYSQPYGNSYWYLDLSVASQKCRIKRLERAWICPVTHQLLGTTFCGYSPLISGRLCEGLFEKYRCTDEQITMPCRPENEEDIDNWITNDENVKRLKRLGLWTDRHKYMYHDTSSYIAAEHSAQQSKQLLREYTNDFRNNRINVLHCSTTMEMGVDIGDIDIVLMDTVPPTAANYLQRVGRAGRKDQSKSIAFSLCNSSPVGLNAFENPMWALETVSRMRQVCPSQTIIQRHVNSYFFRKFICNANDGLNVSTTIDEFMSNTCQNFEVFLQNISTNADEGRRFHNVFGDNVPYTVSITERAIREIRTEYDSEISELNQALTQTAQNDRARRIAIANQSDKLKSENLLQYLSLHLFIPNANMPTGVVTFDFKDGNDNNTLRRLYQEKEKLKTNIAILPDGADRENCRTRLNATLASISELQKSTTAARDIRTALNEYAPEQTVVVNEKNYVSAGITFLGSYNAETQMRGIYLCRHCGYTDYRSNLAEDQHCPDCGQPLHGILAPNNTFYTRAYEPAGFRTDSTRADRIENTDKRYYEIKPVLLRTDWAQHHGISMCDIASSNDTNNYILYYNAGIGKGFAFCKHCGRAAVENSFRIDERSIPALIRQGHQRLCGAQCDATNNDIARHVVFTGKLPTCYSVLRFKKSPGSTEYENDKELAYSLGVILRRALAQSEGIDENEIDFGVKQEPNSFVLFIYDTAKGGCGYSLKLTDPVRCQEVFDIARKSLEDTSCRCHIDGGACTHCLIDRENYRYANLLSKKKALDWLNKQKANAFDVPDAVRQTSPDARAVYQPLKNVVKDAINDKEVAGISLFVSDSNDYAISDWRSVHSEMGKLIYDAVISRKEVHIFVEYHPALHNSLSERLPFINLKDNFPNCEISFINDMGRLKTAAVIEYSNGQRSRYFTDDISALSFSNGWGAEGCHVYADRQDTEIREQDGPAYDIVPGRIIRDGISGIRTSFLVKNYFSEAIAPYVLKDGDEDRIRGLLNGKQVRITVSDPYVNCALASLMLVYLIDEMKQMFCFNIDSITLQVDSSRRNCDNAQFEDWKYISHNFRCKQEADNYTDQLCVKVLNVEPAHSDNTDHHRWLKIEASDGSAIELRPDHGFCGSFKSNSQYRDLDSLNGNIVWVYKGARDKNEDELYYLIINPAPGR